LSIARNAIWLLGCRVSGDVLNLLLFVLISREFGPPGVGAYSYGFAVTSFVFVIGCLGIEDYGLREYARIAASHRPRFVAELLGMQSIMTVMAVIGLGVYLWVTAPSAATLIIVLTLACYQVATALATTLFIPAMGQQRMMGPALADLFCRSVALLTAGAAIHCWHLPISKALFSYPIAGTLSVILATQSARRHGCTLQFIVSRSAMQKILTAVWSFAAIEVFAQLFTRVGVIALSLKIGEGAAGVYATGLRLIEVALMPLGFMGIAAYPRLSQLFRIDLAAFQRVGGDLMWLMLWVGGALAWGLYFVAPFVLVPVLGSRYAGTEPFIKTMAALALVQACEVVLGRLLLASDSQVVRAAVIVIGATVALVLNLVLIPQFGVDGAIYACVVSYLLINATYIFLLRRALTRESLARVFLTLVASLAAGVTLAWLCAAPRAQYWTQALAAAFAFTIVAGASFWYGRRSAILGVRDKLVPW
jgi:O-antigen/teichoic acid export membrane protein